MSDKELTVFLSGLRLGMLTEDSAGRHWFTYDPDGPDRPLSLSMPRRRRPWGPDRVEPFLDGLLPDSHTTRAEIARRYDAVAGNTFSLLAAVGRDCAGAVQILPPDALDTVNENALIPLTHDDIGERLNQLISRRNPSWHIHGEHWSLAGVQEKFALHFRNGCWYQAIGSTPTTHIIKPGVPDLHCQAYNEVLCLTAVNALGLPTADTDYIDFAGTSAVVSHRWDRHTDADGTVHRLHQEDLCQALGISSASKYQADGGPTPADVIALLRSHRLEGDIWLFVRALIANFLLGATDAHAKNYALLLTEESPPRLAPLYDIASIYPYAPGPKSRKLAMKIGSRYGYDEIELRHWIDLAESNDLDPDILAAQLLLDASDLPDVLRRAIAAHPPRTEGERRLATSLETAVNAQCHRVMDWFTGR